MSDENDPERKRYDIVMMALLLHFQYIEEGLRVYITSAYQFVQQRLNGAMPFRYAYEDTEKDALGTLISKFEKLCDDAELVAELRDLVKYRNDVAHRGYLFTGEEQRNPEALAKLTAALETIRDRTKPCIPRLIKNMYALSQLKGKNS